MNRLFCYFSILSFVSCIYVFILQLNGRDSFYGWIVAMYLNYTPLSPNHYLIPSKAKIGSIIFNNEKI